jgi:hypothetical protein
MSEKARWFDRARYGPLLPLPVSARHAVLRKIQRGELVTNTETKALAQEWARRTVKRSERLLLLALLVFIVSLVTALAEFSLHSLGPATTALAMALLGTGSALSWRQAHRFLQRNASCRRDGKTSTERPS